MSLPTLPSLDDPELLLQVFTHRSLQFDGQSNIEDVGDNERLEDLGRSVLDLAITQRFFSKRPFISASEMAVSKRFCGWGYCHSKLPLWQTEREKYHSDAKLDEWVAYYSMKAKMRCDPHLRTVGNEQLLDTPEVSTFPLASN